MVYEALEQTLPADPSCNSTFDVPNPPLPLHIKRKLQTPKDVYQKGESGRKKIVTKEVNITNNKTISKLTTHQLYLTAMPEKIFQFKLENSGHFVFI